MKVMKTILCVCVCLQRKRHYWRLDTKSLTLFQNDSGAKFYKVGERADPSATRGLLHAVTMTTAATPSQYQHLQVYKLLLGSSGTSGAKGNDSWLSTFLPIRI